MQIKATYSFDADPERVFDAMIDPAVVAACLPGCEKLEPTGERKYEAVLKIGVAAVSGRYKCVVRIGELKRPESYAIAVAGRGAAGFVNGQGKVGLRPDGGKTVVEVAGGAKVGGAVARVGQRLLGGVSKTMTDRFFQCLKRKIDNDIDNDIDDGAEGG